jgi:glycosyltransferase involved in cell wall biosynthesis
VVVVTLNAADTLSATLDVLSAQEHPAHEIIVIDNDSIDGSRDIAARHGCQIITVARGTFDHGLTRDLSVRTATGDVVVLLSGDAVPIGKHWLGRLVSRFEDPLVAAVQCPEEAACKRFFWERPGSRYLHFTREHRRWNAEFGFGMSNVAAAWRRGLLLRFPFGRTVTGEDHQVQCQLQRAGWLVVVEPGAPVRHVHAYEETETLRRYVLTTAYGMHAAGMPYRTADLVLDEAIGLGLLGVFGLRLAARSVRHILRGGRWPSSEWTFPLRRPYWVYRGTRLDDGTARSLLRQREAALDRHSLCRS